MTSKTFKSARSTQELTIVKTSENNVRLMYCMEGLADRAIDLALGDIPALMLALGESAGYRNYVGSGDDLGLVVESLDKHLSWVEVQSAEAKERAELEAEALGLFNAYDNVPQKMNEPPLESFEGMPRHVKDRWLAVARKARELAKEATK